MNRTASIDYFLKYYQQVFMQNPNLQINQKMLYAQLMNYGLKNEELNLDLSNYFNDWINRFSSRANLNVFYSEIQPGFLQFHNTKNRTDCKSFKLYVSYPKDCIYECANKIFDYIEQNDMSTLSKISNIVRADSIVLRMDNEDEARKVMNFINSDKQLVESAKNVNPFLVKDGVVGIAYDDMLSYNTVLSDLLSKYFLKHRESNTLTNVSVDDFRAFVSTQYYNNFKDANGIQNFEVSPFYLQRCGDKAHAILNYEQVYKLILLSLDSKVNSNDIIDTISQYKNKVNSEMMVQHYNSIINAGNYNIANKNVNNNLQYVKNIVDNYILYAEQKYGYSDIHIYLSDYLRGNQCCITRDNNYRNLFIQNVSVEQLRQIVGNDIHGYIATVCSKTQDLNNKPDINISKQLVDSYIVYAAGKYGVSNVSAYLISYLRGNESAITRDNNYRSLFSEYLEPSIVLSITGPNIDSYIQNVASYYMNQEENQRTNCI